MSELLSAQAQLQADADALVHALDLEPLLGALGRPIRVGSSAMALMVRRDIDITVVCPRLDAATLRSFAGIGAHLMQQPMISAVRFRNDCGRWNMEPDKYPNGLYLGLTASAADGTPWTLDIWAVDDPARQPDLAHLRDLLPRITDSQRETILTIKTVLASRPAQAPTIPSTRVYEAVMDDGIDTVAQFDNWYAARAAGR